LGRPFYCGYPFAAGTLPANGLPSWNITKSICRQRSEQKFSWVLDQMR
jgi:hypothetical protein